MDKYYFIHSFNLTMKNNILPQIDKLLQIIQEKYLGKYIVLEGLDGSGKTTIKEWLESKLTNTFSVREPGSTDFGESIRNLLLNSEFKLQSLTELFLFMASRTELLHQKIIPALQEQKIVFSDRSYISSFAYQAHPAQIDLNYFKETVAQIYQQQKIDVIVYAKIPYELGLQRSAAIRSADNMEAKGKAFYQKIEEGYNLYLANFIQEAKQLETPEYLTAAELEAVQIYRKDDSYLVILDTQHNKETVAELFVKALASLNF
ncbi:dTMP kinase [Psittacicella gerlachiana]|uniref:Thymidylate kinase n=1 Tax=Psittacicella gerlachiana TaxID=2028574 RepID=A0A3A1YNQ0_9GAMM|nr:dTMP kinase [Psittacicella gerlachiana]RIY38858.1 dTMP kinase [Psittacicella gerlachiana]